MRSRWSPALLLAALLAGAIPAAAAVPLRWLPAAPPLTVPSQAAAVDCPSAALCVAADALGTVRATTAPLAGVAWPVQTRIAPFHRLGSISCPTPARCYAVDDAGAVHAGAPVGPVAAWSATTIDLLHRLVGISCPIAGLCVAVDDAGRVLTSAAPDNPLAWSLPLGIDDHPFDAVSCPTAVLCVAVDDAGRLLVSHDPTAAGSWQASPLARTGALSAVSCPGGGLCVVVAHDGTVYATPDVGAQQPTWSATMLDAQAPLSAVSCGNVGVCMAVDAHGRAFTADHPAAGQPQWARVAADPAGALTAASCRAVTFCVALDRAGSALAATLPTPSVTTWAATVASQTTATLAGTLDPNDSPVGTCHFDWGPSAAYGHLVRCSPTPRATGGDQPVTAQLRGLAALRTYHFRLAVRNAVGWSAGGDGVFTTPAPLTAGAGLVGTPRPGKVLLCKANIPVPTTPTPPTTVTYSWLRDTALIVGANASTYLVTQADATHHLRCRVSISGDGATTTTTSGFTDVPSDVAVRVVETRVPVVAPLADGVRVTVVCSPQAAGRCTIVVAVRARRVVGGVVTSVIVGSGQVTLAAGKRRSLVVAVDRVGRRLLAARGALRLRVQVSGTVVGTLVAPLRAATVVLRQVG